MIRLFVFLAILVSALPVSGQQTRTLEYYLRAARENSPLINDIRNREKISRYQLERSVTEQYILCLLDRRQADFADSLSLVLERQRTLMEDLVRSGMARRSDINLLDVEIAANNELKAVSAQSFHSHLMDLNILCGIGDTADVRLEDLFRFYRHFGVSAGLSFFQKWKHMAGEFSFSKGSWKNMMRCWPTCGKKCRQGSCLS